MDVRETLRLERLKRKAVAVVSNDDDEKRPKFQEKSPAEPIVVLAEPTNDDDDKWWMRIDKEENLTVQEEYVLETSDTDMNNGDDDGDDDDMVDKVSPIVVEPVEFDDDDDISGLYTEAKRTLQRGDPSMKSSSQPLLLLPEGFFDAPAVGSEPTSDLMDESFEKRKKERRHRRRELEIEETKNDDDFLNDLDDNAAAGDVVDVTEKSELYNSSLSQILTRAKEVSASRSNVMLLPLVEEPGDDDDEEIGSSVLDSSSFATTLWRDRRV